MKYSKRLAALLEVDATLGIGLALSLLGDPSKNSNNTEKPDESKTNDSNKKNEYINFFIDGEKKWNEMWSKSTDEQIYYYLIVRTAFLESKNAKEILSDSTSDNLGKLKTILLDTIENIEGSGIKEKLKSIKINLETSQYSAKDFNFLSLIGKFNIASTIKEGQVFNIWYKENIQNPLEENKKEKETK